MCLKEVYFEKMCIYYFDIFYTHFILIIPNYIFFRILKHIIIKHVIIFLCNILLATLANILQHFGWLVVTCHVDGLSAA